MKLFTATAIAFALCSTGSFAENTAPPKTYEIKPLPANTDFEDLPDGVYRLNNNRCHIAISNDKAASSNRKQTQISLSCH